MKVECHCNNVIIEVDKPKQITECNCSICSRYMSLWGYYGIEELKIEIGAFGTDVYSWGGRVLISFVAQIVDASLIIKPKKVNQTLE